MVARVLNKYEDFRLPSPFQYARLSVGVFQQFLLLTCHYRNLTDSLSCSNGPVPLSWLSAFAFAGIASRPAPVRLSTRRVCRGPRLRDFSRAPLTPLRPYCVCLTAFAWPKPTRQGMNLSS